MSTLDITIDTADGMCSASLHLPDNGPAPAVIMYPDAGGARQTFRSMADRLAELGYVVLLPDVYYRTPYEPFSMDTVFSVPAERDRLFALIGGLTPEMSVRDAGTFIDVVLARPEVHGTAVGTTGYCMGGRISLTVAGHHPDRVAAAGSFHGGNLAVEGEPTSPHLLAPNIEATVYVGAAIDDGSFPDEQRDRLRDAFDTAGVRYTIDTYQALHGFAVPDNPTFDHTAAEQHWEALERLYSVALGS
jgi:carboxymethylenebutenolidase